MAKPANKRKMESGGAGGYSIPTTASPYRGAKVVPGPLTRGQKAQNKAAETYKTVTTRSEKQKAADAATSARMKKIQSKARNSNAKATASGAAGAVGGAALASQDKKKTKPIARPGVSAARKRQTKGK